LAAEGDGWRCRAAGEAPVGVATDFGGVGHSRRLRFRWLRVSFHSHGLISSRLALK
jgi:hypothetical protein